MKNGEKSLSKVFDVIEAAGRHPEGVAAKTLATELGMPESTLFRMAKFLVERGYLRRSAGRLTLGAAALRLGALAQRQNPLARVAHPALAALSERTGETVHLAELQGDHIVYVDKVEGSRSVRMASLVGSAGPLYCTGVGKIFLINDDAASLEQYIAENGLEPLTSHTITTREGLLSELDRIGRQGYALDDEECEQGARCVAAGVRDYTGKVVAGISVSGPLHRMEPEHIRRIIPQVQRTAQRLSQLLAYEE